MEYRKTYFKNHTGLSGIAFPDDPDGVFINCRIHPEVQVLSTQRFYACEGPVDNYKPRTVRYCPIGNDDWEEWHDEVLVDPKFGFRDDLELEIFLSITHWSLYERGLAPEEIWFNESCLTTRPTDWKQRN